jgi:hypothetical protein
MNTEDQNEVLDLFTQQPFFQYLMKLKTEMRQERVNPDNTLDELANYLQNVSLSLQSGRWSSAQMMKLIMCLCSALRDVEKRDEEGVWQSMLLCMLTVIKSNSTKMSAVSRCGVLQHLKSFNTESVVKCEAQRDAVWPMSLRKVILTRSQARPAADDGCVCGWIDDVQQEPWRDECPVHVLLHDAVQLGRANVCSHDGVFVLIYFPKGQIWDAGLFIF